MYLNDSCTRQLLKVRVFISKRGSKPTVNKAGYVVSSEKLVHLLYALLVFQGLFFCNFVELVYLQFHLYK